MSIKNQLLNPAQLAPIAVTILGAEYNVRRLTTGRLNDYDKTTRKHQAAQDGEQLNATAAQLVLDSILDEDSKPMSETVSASELMDAQTPGAINAAVLKLMTINYMGEDAESAAKKG